MDIIVVTYANMPSQGMYTHEPTSPKHGERERMKHGRKHAITRGDTQEAGVPRESTSNSFCTCD